MMKFWTVDAFTDRLFSGNPAAVCLVDSFPDDGLMQKIATEINLSETAFLVPAQTASQENSHFSIRWFTPTVEVNLCGHATLAAAHVLWNELDEPPSSPVYFDSRSGVLMARKDENSITLDFPAQYPELMCMPGDLIDALQLESWDVAPVSVSKACDDILVELRTAKEVINLRPDIAKLAEIDCHGIIVTAEGKKDSPYDFVSRYFSPRVGVNEDPVTGAAHCKLTPYWAEKLGKNKFTAFQASKRGGILTLALEHDRVLITGQAVTAFRGKFLAV
ncbi:MAG: PhzF family phenazine biosynthesis protein [Alphaproteobacteria bacterium]|nr:PhzF family phenazine biosynthesis protein [Alphaproteobacteria bacterium]